MTALHVVESQRRLAGRRFEPVAEAELLPDLLTVAKSLSGSSPTVAIPEFVGPFGVADLVAVVPTRDRLSLRIAADVRPLTFEPDAAIVAALTARRAQKPDEVARKLGWPLESVERRLSRLTNGGAVAKTSRGGLLRHPALMPVGRMHALEAKVRDWRRARDQARRYRLWADTATVVLSRMPRAEVDVRGELKGWGIGLAVSSTWLVKPRPHPHLPGRRLFSSELAISALVLPSGEVLPALAGGV